MSFAGSTLGAVRQPAFEVRPRRPNGSVHAAGSVSDCASKIETRRSVGRTERDLGRTSGTLATLSSRSTLAIKTAHQPWRRGIASRHCGYGYLDVDYPVFWGLDRIPFQLRPEHRLDNRGGRPRRPHGHRAARWAPRGCSPWRLGIVVINLIIGSVDRAALHGGWRGAFPVGCPHFVGLLGLDAWRCAGALLSTPLTISVRIGLDSYYRRQALDRQRLIGSGKDLTAESAIRWPSGIDDGRLSLAHRGQLCRLQLSVELANPVVVRDSSLARPSWLAVDGQCSGALGRRVQRLGARLLVLPTALRRRSRSRRSGPGGPGAPVDAFVLQSVWKPRPACSPAPVADQRESWRGECYFDVTGLPPTPSEVARPSSRTGRPGAWERLLDRLLASPRFKASGRSPALARCRALRRNRGVRVRPLLAGAVALSRLRDRCVQPPTSSTTSSFKLATGGRRTGAEGSRESRSQSAPLLAAAGFHRLGTRAAQRGQPGSRLEPKRGPYRAHGHYWHGIPGPHGRLRPLPRPHVRPDPPGRLLPAASLLRARLAKRTSYSTGDATRSRTGRSETKEISTER